MPGEAEFLAANRLNNGAMVLVVRDHKRDGDACIDQGCIIGDAHD